MQPSKLSKKSCDVSHRRTVGSELYFYKRAKPVRSAAVELLMPISHSRYKIRVQDTGPDTGQALNINFLTTFETNPRDTPR